MSRGIARVPRRRALATACCLALLLASAPRAQDASTISPFPRGQALGEALAAFAEGSEAIYYNPALAALSSRPELALQYSAWIEGTGLWSLAGCARLPGRFTVGALGSLFLAENLETTGEAPGGNAFRLNGDQVWVPVLGAGANFLEFNLALSASTVFQVGPWALPLGANLNFGRYDYLGEGKTRISLDVGTVLLYHSNLGLAARIPNPLLRGIIPARMAFVLRHLGFEAAPAGLASDFNSPSFNAAIGFEHFQTIRLSPAGFQYSALSELDVSTLQGLSWGLVNRFDFGEFRVELLFGLNASEGVARPSGGLHARIPIRGIELQVDYGLRSLGSLALVHQVSLGARIDADRLRPKGASIPKDGQILPMIEETRIYLRQKRFEEAQAMIDALLARAPRHPEVLAVQKECSEGKGASATAPR